MKIAVALIFDERKRVLIAKRPLHVSFGGYWEFPGGKLEPNESAVDALVREIDEEVGLTVEDSDLIHQINDEHENKPIHLQVFHVKKYSGVPVIKAQQMDIRWVEISALHDYQFPPRNTEIIQLIAKIVAM